MSVICNTTVLSNFAAIEQLGLLRHLYQRVYVPTSVYEEIRRGLDEGYAFCNTLVSQVHPFHKDGWIQLTSITGEVELQALGNLPGKIHQGEAECLVIAQRRDWLFLTDDRAARKIAIAWDVPLSGTLGCLVLAVERALCSVEQGNDYLSQMIYQGYRSLVTDLSSLLP